MEMRFTDSRPLEPGDSSRGLRPLGWSELCARLTAEHDARRVLAGAVAGIGIAPGSVRQPGVTGQQSGSGCSFHASAATLLQHVEAEPEGPVNPASSANGNGEQGIEGLVPNAAAQRRQDEKCHD